MIPRHPRPRRGAATASAAASRQGRTRETAILCWLHPGRDGQAAGHLARHGPTQLVVRSGLALRSDQPRVVVGFSPTQADRLKTDIRRAPFFRFREHTSHSFTHCKVKAMNRGNAMSSEQPKLETIFARAIEIAAPEERAAFLDQACAGDAELRSNAESLVRDHFRAGAFLQRPAAYLAGTIETSAAAEHPGTVIGPYKLVEQIGEGGMGTVWMAQQIEPVKRLVALKLIKAGMDSKQVIARFEAERQALALMDHPNIAKVLDADTTPSGRPYFVMDLVKGVPITRYCDEHHLTPRQRLELFIPVCQAIQHAHQKGVIHRDLKPSNVLVALYDGKPVPKVIDFGVAKAAGQPLTDKTLVTGFGAIVGT